MDCEENHVEDHRTGKAPLPFAAVISASATEGHDDGPLRATLIFAVIALFEQRTWKYILINGGFITVYFTLIGFILGLWQSGGAA